MIALWLEPINTLQEPKKSGRSSAGALAWRAEHKIHVAVDVLGNPLRCLLGAGQVADITHAKPLIKGSAAQAVLADKGYDADHLLEYLGAQGIEAVIPPKANRLEQRQYDRHVYKDRNLVERLFNRIKQFRRVATRYEKLARDFFGMVCLTCVIIWLD